MPKRSSIPEKIISILIENPKITREEMSKQLEVSYQAVQKHFLSLQKQKIVVPSFSIAETHIKRYLFWISILTKHPGKTEDIHLDGSGSDYQRKLCKEIAETFHKKNDLVEGLIFGGAHIVIGGSYDIMLRLFSDNPDSVGTYVTRFVRSHPAVASTSTAWSLSTETLEDS